MKSIANKILVSGYFGYNNIGDEAILKGLIDGINAAGDVDICVLSKNPEWTQKKYSVKAMNRSNLFDIIKAVYSCDMLISGGGSLLQDVTSKKSIIYYLGILKIAQLLRKKTFIYSQGIGPIKLKRNRILTKYILNKVDFINVRDNASLRELRDLGVNKDVLVTTDTVFGINKVGLSVGKSILEEIGANNGKLNLCFTIMNWKNYSKRTIEEIVNTIEIIQNKIDVNIIFVPFFYHLDLKIQKNIIDKLEKKENIFLVDKYLHVNEYLSLIGNMDLMLSMRLHGLIFATFMGVYPIGISYDPKIDGFMKELNRIQKFYVEDFKAKDIADEIVYSVENLETLTDDLRIYLDRFYNLSKKHNDAVIEVLSR